MFYYLGFYAECRLLQVGRFLADASVFIGQMLLLVLRSIGRAFASLFRGIGRDIAAPFVHFRANVRNLRESMNKEKEEQEKTGRKAATKTIGYVGRGVKYYVGLVANIVGYLMPVAAAVVLGFTVYTLMGKQYVLSVEVNDVLVGYVSDELAIEDAKSIVRSRIRLASDQKEEDWSIAPVFKIAPIESMDSLTTKPQLADNLVLATAEDANSVMEASGLSIDGRLMAATTDGVRLQAFLDEWKESFRDPAKAVGEEQIDFVKDVQIEFDRLYYTESVLSYEDLVDQLSYVSPPQHYVVLEGDTLLSIAGDTGVTVDALRMRNPEYAEEEDDFKPAPGTQILVRRGQPFLQVQKTFQEAAEEPIPFMVEYREDPSRVKGNERLIQQGQDGIKRVVYDCVYIDGELVSRIPRENETVTLLEPVTAIINVGTHEQTDLPTEFSGSYGWPAPVFNYIGRGWQPGGHRGVDIPGPLDAAIIAANQGVVSISGVHWSWGNYVVVDHPDGVQTLYAHLNSHAVSEGDVVSQGQVLGYMGTTGVSFGVHLHFEVLINGSPVDPYRYVSAS